MAEILKAIEITENGIDYIVNEYANGTVEKYIKPIAKGNIVIESELTPIQMQEQILLNTEYLVAMQELSLN